MDFQLESSFDQEQGCWVVSISGEVDIFNSNAMKSKLMEIIGETEADLFINCKNLEYIDSTALGALVAVLKNVKAYNGQIHLINMRSNLSKLFKITNLDRVFSIEGDINAK